MDQKKFTDAMFIFLMQAYLQNSASGFAENFANHVSNPEPSGVA